MAGQNPADLARSAQEVGASYFVIGLLAIAFIAFITLFVWFVRSSIRNAYARAQDDRGFYREEMTAERDLHRTTIERVANGMEKVTDRIEILTNEVREIKTTIEMRGDRNGIPKRSD